LPRNFYNIKKAEIFWETVNLFHSCKLFGDFVLESGFFTFHSQDLAIIGKKVTENFCIKKNRPLKFSNDSRVTLCPRIFLKTRRDS